MSLAGVTHVIFSDTNIDALQGKNCISAFLSQYKMVANPPRHKPGSRLEPVYIFKELYYQVEVNSLIKSVYFRDYEAAKVVMKLIRKE